MAAPPFHLPLVLASLLLCTAATAAAAYSQHPHGHSPHHHHRSPSMMTATARLDTAPSMRQNRMESESGQTRQSLRVLNPFFTAVAASRAPSGEDAMAAMGAAADTGETTRLDLPSPPPPLLAAGASLAPPQAEEATSSESEAAVPPPIVDAANPPPPPPVADEPFRDATSHPPPSLVVDEAYRDATTIPSPPPLVVVDEAYRDVVASTPPPPVHDDADAARVVSSGTGDDLGLQQIAKVLASLGHNEMASSATLLVDSTPVVMWPGAITVFGAPSVFLQHSCPDCSRRHLLLDHMALGYFLCAELAAAPAMKLPSVSAGFCLDVAAQPQRGPFSVHHASLYVGRYVVHGLHGFIPPLSHASCVIEAEAHAHHHLKVFALDDQVIFTGGGHGYVSAVRFHIVSGHRLTRADLLLLRPGTILPTLAGEDQMLVITLGAGSATDKVRVTTPDVVINSRVAVHGIYLLYPRLHLAAWVAVALLAAAQHKQAGHLRVVTFMLLVACSISASTAAAPPRCDAQAGATSFGLLCSSGGKPPERCCEWILKATDHAGVNCLCWVAAEPSVRYSGYGVGSVLATYDSCGGILNTSGACTGDFVHGESTDKQQLRHRHRHRKALPPPHHQHHRNTPRHRKKRDASVVADDEEHGIIEEDNQNDEILHVTHHQLESSSLKGKLETAGIIMVLVVVPSGVLALVCYVFCAGPGSRQARARMLLDTLISLLPHIFAAWRGSRMPVHPTSSELVVAPMSSYGVPIQTESSATITNGGAIVAC